LKKKISTPDTGSGDSDPVQNKALTLDPATITSGTSNPNIRRTSQPSKPGHDP
jgi:hypothetical protein